MNHDENQRPDHRVAIERLAKARQDNKIIFNDPEVVGDGVTKTTIAHESGPAAKAEHSAAREVVQAMANEVGAESGDLIRAAAYADHASYPQYAGMWDGWLAVRMARQLRVKSGVIAAGDWVLFDGEDTVYSITIGGNVACDPSKDLVVPAADESRTIGVEGLRDGFKIERDGEDADVLRDGEVVGIVNKMEGGTYSAIAFKRQRVKSRSSRSGWRWASETWLGASFPTVEAAADAIAEVF